MNALTAVLPISKDIFNWEKLCYNIYEFELICDMERKGMRLINRVAIVATLVFGTGALKIDKSPIQNKDGNANHAQQMSQRPDFLDAKPTPTPELEYRRAGDICFGSLSMPLLIPIAGIGAAGYGLLRRRKHA